MAQRNANEAFVKYMDDELGLNADIYKSVEIFFVLLSPQACL